MSGFKILFNTPFFQNRQEHSIVLLKNLWTHGLRATFSEHDMTELRFKPDDWAVMTVHSFHGISWLYLPILPFILLHESFHLVLAYLTPRQNIIRFVPPLLDFLYLPVAFILIFKNPTFLGLVIGDWFSLTFICLLMGNLTGDFRRQKRHSPQSAQP